MDSGSAARPNPILNCFPSDVVLIYPQSIAVFRQLLRSSHLSESWRTLVEWQRKQVEDSRERRAVFPDIVILSIPSMSRLKRVLLLIESSRAYGRGCLAGVAAYVRAHPQWRMLHVERSLVESPPRSLRKFAAEGVIARSETVEMARAISRLRVPTVDLLGAHPPRYGVTLDTDPAHCAKLAADHLLDRRFSNFGYCGYPGVRFSDQRCDAFVRSLQARGFAADVYVASKRLSGRFDTVARETDAEYSELGLSDWVRRLPKPVAIFACNDVRARQVLVSCGNTGFRVPDDVAVLGVDNDEVICDLSSPPLSSVEPNTWQIGYTGAALLDKLMAGGSVAQQRVLISPQRVQVRRSTDVVAVEDPEVAAGLGYIQDNACRGICVSDVASTLSVSRTTLDRRFHRCLGRSPKDEIDRVRIDRARLLLDVTDYKIRVVASMAGYRSASQFVNAFKRITGCTPGMHRDRSNPGKQAAAGS